MPKSKTLLTKQQKEAMADAIARFFFDYWQKQSNKRVNKVATLEAGSTHREGSPAPKVAS